MSWRSGLRAGKLSVRKVAQWRLDHVLNLGPAERLLLRSIANAPLRH
jgi:hypothetical protein